MPPGIKPSRRPLGSYQCAGHCNRSSRTTCDARREHRSPHGRAASSRGQRFQMAQQRWRSPVILLISKIVVTPEGMSSPYSLGKGTVCRRLQRRRHQHHSRRIPQQRTLPRQRPRQCLCPQRSRPHATSPATPPATPPVTPTRDATQDASRDTVHNKSGRCDFPRAVGQCRATANSVGWFSGGDGRKGD